MALHPAIKPAMRPGQRVEVLWHRGEADVWYRGTMLRAGAYRWTSTCRSRLRRSSSSSPKKSPTAGPHRATA